MLTKLPKDLLLSLQYQIACRQDQLRQLSILYNASFPSPDILVCNGLEDSGKLETILTILDSQKIDHVLVKSNECLSQRHLMAKIFTACLRETGKETAAEQYDRVDNFSSLLENLRKMFEKRDGRLVLVLDGVDEQKGASATLLPALARVGKVIPCLSVIMTTSSPRPLILHKVGVSYVHFPSYTRAEIIQILSRSPPALMPEPLPVYTSEPDHKELLQLYKQFITAVYDTLHSSTTTSLRTFQQTCARLWPRFIWPMVLGETPPGNNFFEKWDFARLLSRSRGLFLRDGEKTMQDHLRADRTTAVTFADLIKQKEEQDLHASKLADNTDTRKSMTFSNLKQPDLQPHPPLLKHFTTLVLLAAYLGSHNLQKHDIVLFSRLSSSSFTKRKYLTKSRRGGITKASTKSKSRDEGENNDVAMITPSDKSKAKEINAAEATTPKKERADRSMRAIFERTSNIARPFTLERLIAILRAIHPDGIPQRRGTSDRVYMELAELERLKLVVRAVDNAMGPNGARSGGAGDLNADDIMEEKWRVNVGKEWVQGMGKIWGVSLEGWEIVD